MATEQAIKTELGRLAILYRHPLDPDEFTLIAEAWTEDFENVDDDIFRRALVEYRKRHRFFPQGTHELLELCAMAAAERSRNMRALPEIPSQEMLENNARQAQKLLAKLCAGASALQ